VSGAVGVTLNVPAGYEALISTVHATFALKKVDTNEWDLIGLLDEAASA
jgi:hypothetical protein